MDRRMMAGAVALALIGPATARAMQMRDPSAAGRVDFTPLDPIDERINASPAEVARSPQAQTQAPPPAPARSGGLFRWFGRRKAATPAAAAPRTAANARGPRPPAPGTKLDQQAVPARLGWDAAGDAPSGMAGDGAAGDAAPRAGRPSPFAAEAPDAPRPQRLTPLVDESDGTAALGRPAPFRSDAPRAARPQAATPPAASRPRPQTTPPGDPAPADPAAPAIPPSLPPVDPGDLAAPGDAPTPDPGPVDPPPAGPPEADPAAPPARPEAADDAEVRQTAGDPSALKIDAAAPGPARPYASARAAAVGDEVITVHEVELLVRDKIEEYTGGQSIGEADRREMIDTLGAMALEFLIEQRLVIQEARRLMRGKPKVKEKFDEFVAERWREDRLPGLLRKHGAANEYELRLKLDESGGRTYAEIRQEFHDALSEQAFLVDQIRNKVVADLSQQRAYYNQHLKDFDRPARISWREFEVAVGKHPDRAAARAHAEAMLARLRREDFAAVAAASDGPTAKQGGLYADMTPGSYAIAPVNDVLAQIPVGQISAIIEAPESFHIVRVESRREAGPLPFDEVQKRVAELVLKRNEGRARKEFIAQLRARTLVRVMPEFRQSLELQERRRRAEDDPAVRAASAR